MVTGIDLGESEGSGLGEGEIQANYSDNLLTLTVPNERVKGSYSIELEKVDKDDNSKKLEGAIFKVTLPSGEEKEATTDQNGKN